MSESFHNTSSGDFESTFIKVGDSDTGRAQGRRRNRSLTRWGCCQFTGESEARERDKWPLTIVPLIASLVGEFHFGSALRAERVVEP